MCVYVFFFKQKTAYENSECDLSSDGCSSDRKARYCADTEVNTIGTSQGEKLYDTLVTREEMAKSIYMGDYYRIPCDNRELNYDKFFTEGDEEVSKIEDYHSHNTARLDVEGMKQLLLKLRFVREDLGMEEKSKTPEIKSE